MVARSGLYIQVQFRALARTPGMAHRSRTDLGAGEVHRLEAPTPGRCLIPLSEAAAVRFTMTSSLHDAIKVVVDEADPIGLLSGGAPDDEYEPEISDLEERIAAGEVPTEVMVWDVIARWFGPNTTAPPEAVEQIVRGLSRLADGDL